MECSPYTLISANDFSTDQVVWLLWSLASHSRIFHSYGDVTIAGKGLQILTYARH